MHSRTLHQHVLLIVMLLASNHSADHTQTALPAGRRDAPHVLEITTAKLQLSSLANKSGEGKLCRTWALSQALYTCIHRAHPRRLLIISSMPVGAVALVHLLHWHGCPAAGSALALCAPACQCPMTNRHTLGPAGGTRGRRTAQNTKTRPKLGCNRINKLSIGGMCKAGEKQLPAAPMQLAASVLCIQVPDRQVVAGRWVEGMATPHNQRCCVPEKGQ